MQLDTPGTAISGHLESTHFGEPQSLLVGRRGHSLHPFAVCRVSVCRPMVRPIGLPPRSQKHPWQSGLCLFSQDFCWEQQQWRRIGWESMERINGSSGLSSTPASELRSDSGPVYLFAKISLRRCCLSSSDPAIWSKACREPGDRAG